MRGVGGRGVPSTRIVRARSRRCQRRVEHAAAPRQRVGYCRSDRWDLVPWPPAHAARCRRSSCSSQRAARRLPPSSQRLVRRSSRLGRTAGWGSQPPPRGCSAAAPTSIRASRTTGRPGKIRTTSLRWSFDVYNGRRVAPWRRQVPEGPCRRDPTGQSGHRRKASDGWRDADQAASTGALTLPTHL